MLCRKQTGSKKKTTCILYKLVENLLSVSSPLDNYSSEAIVFISHNESASVAQLDAPSGWRPGGCGFNPRRGRQHSFVEIDHEIFSTIILSLPLISRRAVVSFWRKNVHNTGLPIRGLSLPSKRVVR